MVGWKAACLEVMTCNFQTRGTVPVGENRHLIGRQAEGRGYAGPGHCNDRHADRNNNATSAHKAVRVFLASSAPGNLSLSFSAACKFFLAPSLSPFMN